MSYIFTCLKKRHISASPYFLINSNLVKQIPFKVNGNLFTGYTVIYFNRAELLKNYSKFNISSSTTFSTFTTNNDAGSSQTTIDSSVTTLDLLSFANQQTTTYIGLKGYGQINFNFEIG